MILDKDFSFKKMGRKSLKKSTGSIMDDRFNKSQLNLFNDCEVKKDKFFRVL
jgi:hypothetical protein